MADTKRVTPSTGTGLEAISGLLNMFGQNQKQTATADTSALTDLLAKLGASTDPNAQLEAIFQQAAGAIPGLASSFRATGARASQNTPMNAALQKLLQETTLAGQKQIAEQELQRQQIQGQAAGNLANSTRAVSQTTSPNTSMAAKVLGGLTLLEKTGLGDKLLKGSKLLGAGGAAGGAGDAISSSLFSGDAYGNFTSSMIPQNFLSTASETSLGEGIASNLDWGNLFSSVGSEGLTSAAADVGSEVVSNVASEAASEAGSGFIDTAIDTVKGWFGWADGGLIGRDEGTPYEPESYADGGVVRSGGGRRSSAPTFTPVTRATTAAVNSSGQRPASTSGTSAPTGKSSGGGGGGLGRDRESMDIGGSSSFDFGSIPVSNGVGPTSATGPTLGPGVIGTGIPNWAIGLVGGLLGMNPLLSFALKQGNDYLTKIDPLNPSGPNYQNQMDRESDAAQAARDAANGGPDGGAFIDPNADPWSDPNYDPMNGFPDVETPVQTPIENNGDFGNSFGGTGSWTGSDFGGDFSGGDYGGGTTGGWSPAETAMAANGGKVAGPGTGTSDSIPAMVSHGEYIIPADVVDALGADFFDNLRNKFHTMTQPQGQPQMQGRG